MTSATLAWIFGIISVVFLVALLMVISRLIRANHDLDMAAQSQSTQDYAPYPAYFAGSSDPAQSPAKFTSAVQADAAYIANLIDLYNKPPEAFELSPDASDDAHAHAPRRPRLDYELDDEPWN